MKMDPWTDRQLDALMQILRSQVSIEHIRPYRDDLYCSWTLAKQMIHVLVKLDIVDKKAYFHFSKGVIDMHNHWAEVERSEFVAWSNEFYKEGL